MKVTALRIERRTYDGALVAYWDAVLLRQRSNLLIWHAAPMTPIIYPRRGFSTTRRGHEIGWVWRDRRYTVAVELTEAGELARANCRIVLPPAITREVVSITELGLSLLVEPGPVVKVEDDEFQEAATDYGYDPQLRAAAWSALDEVRALLQEGSGPFGPDLAKMHALALKQSVVGSR